MKTFPTLYKRTTSGKIQQWTLQVDGDQYRPITGLTDGKKIPHEWKKATPKNTGRANATTAEEQAMLEAEALFKKQTEKHYFEDIKDIDKSQFFKPMLASPLKKVEDLSFPVFVQPKLDGIRCIITKNGMQTRGGKEIISAPHIFEELTDMGFFKDNPNAVLDGELYAHSDTDNFNEIVSMAKKTKPTQKDLEKSKQHLQLWLYDMVEQDTSGDKVPFSKRVFQNKRMQNLGSLQYIEVVETVQVKDIDGLNATNEGYLEQGYEGSIIRTPSGLYENKRSKGVIKYKTFNDAEFEIVELVEGKGNYSGMIKSVTLKDEDGTVFNSGIQGKQAYLKQLKQAWEANPNTFIGKEATVCYFNKTVDGSYRFPVVKAIHTTERW